MSISVQLQGDEELQRAFRALVDETQDMRPAWDAYYRPHFHSAMEQTFSTKQSGTWRPLKKRYAAWKSSHGGGDLMVLSGALRASLTGETGESVYEPQEREMKIGSTNMPTNTPRGRMVIWGDSTAMTFHMTNAAKEHLERFGRVWERGV